MITITQTALMQHTPGRWSGEASTLRFPAGTWPMSLRCTCPDTRTVLLFVHVCLAHDGQAHHYIAEPAGPERRIVLTIVPS